MRNSHHPYSDIADCLKPAHLLLLWFVADQSLPHRPRSPRNRHHSRLGQRATPRFPKCWAGILLGGRAHGHAGKIGFSIVWAASWLFFFFLFLFESGDWRAENEVNAALSWREGCRGNTTALLSEWLDILLDEDAGRFG